jgi:hypothetical protein
MLWKRLDFFDETVILIGMKIHWPFIWWGREINDDYAWEFSALHKYRPFSDGISFLEFNVNWDRYLADHTPRFGVMLVILNFKVFEFSIYYMYHRDNEDVEIPPVPIQ